MTVWDVRDVSGDLKTEKKNFEKRLAVLCGELETSSFRCTVEGITECCLRSLVYFQNLEGLEERERSVSVL